MDRAGGRLDGRMAPGRQRQCRCMDGGDSLAPPIREDVPRNAYGLVYALRLGLRPRARQAPPDVLQGRGAVLDRVVGRRAAEEVGVFTSIGAKIPGPDSSTRCRSGS